VIGVRVSASERAAVCERASAMHMTPAEWLRTRLYRADCHHHPSTPSIAPSTSNWHVWRPI
jgi:hypothetical protein